MQSEGSIFIAGHSGLAGSAILRAFQSRGYSRLIVRTHQELELTDARAVKDFFQQERPEYVFLAAAKVGGIQANNTLPAEFLRENLLIQTHVLHEAWQAGVKKLLFLGSSCIYPKLAPQPIPESALLTGELEPTNDAYALAKITVIQLCKAYRKQHGANFIAVMPTNLYGPQDNFHPEHSHVLPALLRRFHEAQRDGLQEVTVWGSGTPRREFLHSDDLASACLFLMEHYDSPEIINIGWGQDCTIRELAEMIAKTVSYTGKLKRDDSRPDGTPRKVLDNRKLSALGWEPKISLQEGLRLTYQWYLENHG